MPSAVRGDGKINIQPEVTMALLETRNTTYFFQEGRNSSNSAFNTCCVYLGPRSLVYCKDMVLGGYCNC